MAFLATFYWLLVAILTIHKCPAVGHLNRNFQLSSNAPPMPRQACLLLITYSNSQRKTHKIAQIRHVEPQKRQHTIIEVGLHLFWALTRPFLDISLRYKTLQYSSTHFCMFQTNNQTRCLCGPPVLVIVITKAAPAFFYSCWLKTIILKAIVWTKIWFCLLAISLILFK